MAPGLTTAAPYPGGTRAVARLTLSRLTRPGQRCRAEPYPDGRCHGVPRRRCLDWAILTPTRRALTAAPRRASKRRTTPNRRRPISRGHSGLSSARRTKPLRASPLQASAAAPTLPRQTQPLRAKPSLVCPGWPNPDVPSHDSPSLPCLRRPSRTRPRLTKPPLPWPAMPDPTATCLAFASPPNHNRALTYHHRPLSRGHPGRCPCRCVPNLSLPSQPRRAHPFVS